jgi:translation initiation factor IF-3
VKKGLRINGGIRADKVRLVDDANNQVGVIPRDEALSRAQEAGMDLVEVSPNSEPPVCRIMDYGKWLYQQKRRVRDAHKKTAHPVATLKEIRLRPETERHDLEIKVKHAREFLEKGHRVQFSVLFRGRQMLHKEQGYDMLNQITENLTEIAKIERPSVLTGRRMTLLLVPK